ncbi:MAG TPA: DUF1634 domain-containing protein [Bryobacteraceae bacterium]|nr:DUF1634 domain-containing protein [Bryobacteraceae bacterium]
MNDERLDRSVGIVLRTGVILAAALVLIGGIAFLVSQHQPVPDRHKFHPEATPFTIAGVWQGAIHLEPAYLILLGLLVLIATPIVRVITCLAGFALERDWLYATISLIVLTCLLGSIIASGL